MKKILLGILSIVVVIGLTACGNQKEENKTSGNNSNINIITNDNQSQPLETNDLTDDKMYEGIISNYKNAVAEYDLEDIDSDAKLEQKYPLVNFSLIMHIARYSSKGVKLTYAFYDVNKDGTNELLVGADNACGAIYSYNKNSNQVVKIQFLDTMERGNLSIYDNGVILKAGAGGAAIHYYEYGKISKDTISYEVLEAIVEEYVDGNEIPEYRKYDTEEVLDYQSLTEINEKYLSDAKTFENINFSPLSDSLETNTSENKITKEMAYEGISNYCHSEYDWSIAEENTAMMYLEMEEETETEYQVLFHSYTGAIVYFYVDKSNGNTRMVEYVPTLNAENEAGTINLYDYLNENDKVDN